MEGVENLAYLREFQASNQCELMFNLKVEIADVGLIEKDVKAVRQVTDDVESLLQHIVNKINNLIKKANCDKENETINVFLNNALNNKEIKRQRILKTLFDNNTCLEFGIFNQKFKVVINAPLVKEIKLPVVFFAKFQVQPRKFYTVFADNKASKFFWHKSKDKEDWKQVANTFRYAIKDEDLGHYLKLVCIPCKDGVKGPSVEVISENVVESIGELPTCPFEKRHEFTATKLSDNKFRVVSYNVLSNRYAENNNEHFPYCTPRALALDYRKQLIGKELLGYKADIICLQEVDSCAYIAYYRDLFKNEGYSTYYHRKGNRIPEGLACVFNKSRFKKIEDYQLVYADELQKKNHLFNYLWKVVRMNTDVKDCFVRQATSLQITVLKEKDAKGKKRFVIVANTHLFYHPDAEHIRLLQVYIATTHLGLLRKRFSKGGNAVTVLFCGDFNCVPTSQVCSYLTKGTIDKQHEVVKKNNIELSHLLNFKSACGMPKYTNYTHDFKDCLDYIFVEQEKVDVLNVVPFPSEEELAVYEGLPNDVYPSDHLALVVDLEHV